MGWAVRIIKNDDSSFIERTAIFENDPEHPDRPPAEAKQKRNELFRDMPNVKATVLQRIVTNDERRAQFKQLIDDEGERETFDFVWMLIKGHESLEQKAKAVQEHPAFRFFSRRVQEDIKNHYDWDEICHFASWIISALADADERPDIRGVTRNSQIKYYHITLTKLAERIDPSRVPEGWRSVNEVHAKPRLAPKKARKKTTAEKGS